MSKIRDRRLKFDLTQQEIASLVGLSRQAYIAVESMASAPRVDVAIRIAEVLHSSVEDLFGSEKVTPELEALELSRYMVADFGGDRRLVRLPSDHQGTKMGADVLGYESEDGVKEVSLSGWESTIYTGCDPALAVLSQYVEMQGKKVHHRWLNKPNRDSISDLRDRNTHFAVLHHSEESQADTQGFESMSFSQWELVLAYRPGLSTSTSFVDMVGSEVVFAGRSEGSGVYDFMLSKLTPLGVDPYSAFERFLICKDHEQVAMQLAVGSADVGLTSLSAALAHGLHFETVDVQSSELLYDKEVVDERLVAKVGGEIVSQRFRLELQAITGYR